MTREPDGADTARERLIIGGQFEDFVPVELLERGDGRLIVGSEFEARHLNAAGLVHGGFVSALLDVALAGAAASAVNGGAGVYGITLSMTINFVHPLGPGPVRCAAKVRGGGRRTKFVDADLIGAEAEPAATGTATVRVVDLQPGR